MNEAEIRTVLHEELNNIAPEANLAALDPTADLREALDIDSMDFLNFVIAVNHRLGVDIPEIDYPELLTLQKAIVYLQRSFRNNGQDAAPMSSSNNSLRDAEFTAAICAFPAT